MIYFEEPSTYKERRKPTQKEIEKAMVQTGIDYIYKANVKVSEEEVEKLHKEMAKVIRII